MKTSKRVRVLYADDNEDACLMLTLLLGYSGIDVRPASTIAEALREAKNSKFDAYLLDSRFEDGTGFNLCRWLREMDPSTPVVFYSGDCRPDDKRSGLDAGASAYLAKPYVDKVAPTIMRLVAKEEDGARPAKPSAS